MTTPAQGGVPDPPLRAPSEGAGSASSAGSLLHAGELLAGRYRIVSRLGGGGMGEVYRADDLTLGSPVALKFLPPEAIMRPGWLDRFRTEVRLTRQISHPNVCRVYDIAEIDGRVFLSMEFIDGEDLSSLIRRIGRLPQDKAVEIARQLCFGLSAAHELGVIHRDLKPANIMVDGRGIARIMDFGVAGFAAELNQSGKVAAGTPAYMAPEQLEGREVSRRSDIFSLGLVLYEVFTGKPAFKAQTLADLREIHLSSTRPTSPTELVAGLDPAVERVILRCIEHDPASRPASAVAIAAALPGGDPLAAALAAGETPSPELVAASGEAGTLRPVIAMALAAMALVLLLAVVTLRDRLSLLRYASLENSAEVLAAKARSAVRTLGYDEKPRSVAYGFVVRKTLLAEIERLDTSPQRWDKLLDPALTPIAFWYRTSSNPLRPTTWWRLDTTYDDPPAASPGDTTLITDIRGDLRAFARHEPIRSAAQMREMSGQTDQADARADAESPAASAVSDGADPDSAVPARAVEELLSAAMGVDKASIVAATPRRLYSQPSDARLAFTTALPGGEPVPVTVEVGMARGRIVGIETIYPWSYRAGDDAGSSLMGQVAGFGGEAIQLGILFAGAVLARRNLRTNRSDRRGAWRLAGVAFVLNYTTSQFAANWGANPVENLFGIALVRAVYFAFLWWMFYTAMEPTLRRVWPHAIISWSRLLDGRWRDPLVGRDVLAGMLAGLVLLLLQEPAIHLAASITGSPAPQPMAPNVVSLTSARLASGQALGALHGAIVVTLLTSLGLVIVRVLVRKAMWAAAVLFAVFYVMAIAGPHSGQASGYVLGLAWAGVMTLVFLRLGVLSSAAMICTAMVLMRIPATLDFSNWYAVSGVPVVLGIAAIVLLCARSAVGRQRLFSKSLLEA